MKNILFVDNWTLHENWINIIEAFEKCNYKIHVLALINHDHQWAKKRSYKIHYFNNFILRKKSISSFKSLQWDWKGYYTRIRKKNKRTDIENQISFLEHVLFETEPYIVLGEKTWPHELCMMRLCRQRRINYFSIITVRKPQNLCFMSTKYEEPFTNLEGSLTDIEAEEAYNFIKKGEMPDYTIRDIIGPKFQDRLNTLKIFLKYSLLRDQGRVSLKLKVGNYIKSIINKNRIRFVKSTKYSKFVYFLHIQPESSIDYLGAGNRNNSTIFDWIQHNLYTGKINVSNNKNFISYKPHDALKGHYEDLEEIILTWDKLTISSKEALEKQMVPITISGTIGLEALAKGIKPIIIGKPFFMNFSGVIKVNSSEDFDKALNYKQYRIFDESIFKKEFLSILEMSFNLSSKKNCLKFIKNNHKKMGPYSK